MSRSRDITHLPAPQTQTQHSKPYHIYFIPGNPGLVSYYTTFLTILHRSLNSPNFSSLARVTIHGESLAGFELDSQPRTRAPLSLQSQISHVQSRIAAYSAQHAHPRLILIGHSVGAYIALEVLRRRLQDANVVAAILLFPTVTHIAASPNGLRSAWLLRTPGLSTVVGWFAWGMAWLLRGGGGGGEGEGGGVVLTALCRWMLGMTEAAATTTAGFLESKGGVRQALHMARDEMDEITEDRWDEDIWGASTSASTSSPASSSSSAADSSAISQPRAPAKLFFLFGRSDHWVADHTRDELMASRGVQSPGGKTTTDQHVKRGDEEARPLLGTMDYEATGTSVGEGEEWRPWMEIDETGVPHGFCIRHNEPVAAKVEQYIQHIVENARA